MECLYPLSDDMYSRSGLEFGSSATCCMQLTFRGRDLENRSPEPRRESHEVSGRHGPTFLTLREWDVG